MRLTGPRGPVRRRERARPRWGTKPLVRGAAIPPWGHNVRRVPSANGYPSRTCGTGPRRGIQMRFMREGGLRRLALVICTGVLAALAVAGATSARVDVGSSGSAGVALANDDKVTICHAAGQEGTTHFVT